MKNDVVNNTVYFVTAAFAMIVALAWNEAIKSMFAEGGKLHFLAKQGVWVYALVVTILAVLVTVYIGKVTGVKNSMM